MDVTVDTCLGEYGTRATNRWLRVWDFFFFWGGGGLGVENIEYVDFCGHSLHFLDLPRGTV